ncbi:MAG: ParB N-terminal domain-containing protein [Kofleriaceae bacterium]
MPETAPHLQIVHAWQERRLGRTVLRTYRTTVDIDEVLPNPRQPRIGEKVDPELQLQIEANEGVFEPLLLEPHPQHEGKYQIIDGDRRWTNSRILVDDHKKDQYRKVPAEITHKTLDDEERLRVWIYIHRQRKEWDAREKEMVACRLVEIVGRASAANILGTTVRDLDKLVDVYKLSERLKNIRDPNASITWAREIKGINHKLLTPTVMDTIVDKINAKLITNSKEVRQLRAILKDPVAKDCFEQSKSTITDALARIGATKKPRKKGIGGDLASLVDAIRRHPWTDLADLRGDDETIRTIEEAEKLLKDLKKTLKS